VKQNSFVYKGAKNEVGANRWLLRANPAFGESR
jgi:hypothetical protein